MDCNWDNPGTDPYRGPIFRTATIAVARYEFPKDAQAELVRKIRRLENDAIISISKVGLQSNTGIATNLRDMHFGKQICKGPVNRQKWKDNHTEKALVYCAGVHCVAIPIVCGNISRIDFVPTVKNKEPDRLYWHEYQPLPKVNLVDTPSTLALVLLGFFLLFSNSKRDRK